MPFEIIARCGRTESFTINLFEADGLTAANIQNGDTARVKIGRASATAPVMDLNSDTPTANGSSVTFSAGTDAVQLRLAQADTLPLIPGAYRCEIDVVDNNDAQVGGVAPVKCADSGVIHLMSSLSGGVGL